jgi:Rrf2 family protein
VRSQRGSEGGYWLIGEASDISLADVIRAVEGPMASIRGRRPEDIPYAGSAEALQQVWIAVRANLRAVLEATTLADVAGGTLPAHVRALAAASDAWTSGAAREAPPFTAK